MTGKVFISYRRRDDAAAAGRLHDYLAARIGRDRLFMDVDGIPLGVDFVDYLETQVNQCTHLLAVIGRGWVEAADRLHDEGDFVRVEILAAMARPEVKVIPVMFDDHRMPAADALPPALHLFRRRNGLRLSHENFAAVVDGKLLPALGEQPETARVAPAPDPAPDARTGPEAAYDLIVDQTGGGDHADIADAVMAAAPEARIGVRPGRYVGGIVMDKKLDIVGLGARGDVIWEAEGEDVVYWSAPGGRVANLSLRLRGGAYYTVDFNGGHGLLENCDLASEGLAIVAIRNGANPVVRGNRIADGGASGVSVQAGGCGTVEDNDILRNDGGGVAISHGGDPVVRGNRINDGKASGVFVYENGRGTVEENEIARSAFCGVEIKEGGDPLVRNNRIVEGKQSGVFALEKGRGTIEGNEIARNAGAGVLIKSGAELVARGNTVTGNGLEAVWVSEEGRGTFIDNDLRGNGRGSYDIEDTAGPVTREGNQED